MSRRSFHRMTALLMLAIGISLPAQQYVFDFYGQANGLNDLGVKSLAVDREGFLWIGTENGLYRLVGSRIQRYGPAAGITEQFITDVYSAPDGSLWVGSSENLYRWTGEHFETAGPTPINVDSSTSITAESPGHLLVYDGNHLHRLIYGLDGHLLSASSVFAQPLEEAHPSLQNLGGIAVLPDSTLWVGCGRQLCSSHAGELTFYDERQGVPDDTWREIVADSSGSVWAIGSRHVIERQRGEKTFYDQTPHDAKIKADLRFQRIALDPQDRIVLGTTHGLYRRSGSDWRPIGRRNGLEQIFVTALTFDPDGDLWLGTNGTGLYHWVGYRDWEGWTEAQGLPSSHVWAALPLDGSTTYIGTEGGPAAIDTITGQVKALFKRGQWRYGQVNGLVRDAKGMLWAGMRSGDLVRIATASQRVTPIAKLPAGPLSLVQARSGNLFIGTSRGVYEVDHPEAGSKPRLAVELNSLLGRVPTYLTGCASTDGSVWFLSEQQLFRFKDGSWTVPTIHGLDAQIITSHIECAVDGSIWIMDQKSSGGTLHVAFGRDGGVASRLPWPQEDRLLTSFSLLADKRGWLWIATNAGVLVWNGSSWRQLTQESGLIWNDTDWNAMAAAPDGSVWIGTSFGVSHLTHPERIFNSAQLPLTMIAMRHGANLLPIGKSFTVPTSKEELAFQFASPSEQNRSDLLYSYRIAGLNSAWAEDTATVARFPSLPFGDYTFEVFAHNSSRNVTSKTIGIHFQVLPPWWRTSWFYLICAMMFALVLWSVHTLRTRHLTRSKRRLEEQVLERTRELELSREELRIQATHDVLTGLKNRFAILSMLDSEIAREQREERSLIVVLADIDHFKRVNDTHGHLAGDSALRQFAAALSSSVRSYDHVGRYGGEEFLIVLTGIKPSDREQRLAQLHSSATNLTVCHGSLSFQITCSMGGIWFDPSRYDIEQNEALAAADVALYAAKESGRNRIIYQALSHKTVY